MVNPEILSARLRALASYLDKLKVFRSVQRDEFVSEDALHDLAERYLHLAMECVLDAGNHIIADRGLPTPRVYKDIFAILATGGVISSALSEKLQRWAGLRNILVHNYLEIDHGIAYDIIQNDLHELEEFSIRAAACL